MSLVQLLVLVLVFGLIFYLLQSLPIAEPFKQIALVIFVVIVILLLLAAVGLIPGGTVRVGALPAPLGRMVT
jgi:hypothetical protein